MKLEDRLSALLDTWIAVRQRFLLDSAKTELSPEMRLSFRVSAHVTQLLAADLAREMVAHSKEESSLPYYDAEPIPYGGD